MSITISSIYFSPVKSISFQEIKKCQIKKNIGIVNDRLYAFSRLIDSERYYSMQQEPKQIKLNFFLTLRNTPSMNKYSFEYDESKLELFLGKKKIISINPNNPMEVKFVENEMMKLEKLVKGPIFLIKNDKNPFFDTTSNGENLNSISLINHSSIKDLENKIGKKIEHQRFRGNFYVRGLPPWEERKLVGKNILINGTPFKVEDNIKRCSVINLKPGKKYQTFNLHKKLKEFYNHIEFGVYISPLQDGTVHNGDLITY